MGTDLVGSECEVTLELFQRSSWQRISCLCTTFQTQPSSWRKSRPRNLAVNFGMVRRRLQTCEGNPILLSLLLFFPFSFFSSSLFFSPRLSVAVGLCSHPKYVCLWMSKPSWVPMGGGGGGGGRAPGSNHKQTKKEEGGGRKHRGQTKTSNNANPKKQKKKQKQKKKPTPHKKKNEIILK